MWIENGVRESFIWSAGALELDSMLRRLRN